MPPTTPAEQPADRQPRAVPWWTIASVVVSAARLVWDVVHAFGVGGP